MTVFDENQKNFARVSSKIENKKLISSNGLDFSGNNFDSVLKSVKTDKTGSDKKNDDKKNSFHLFEVYKDSAALDFHRNTSHYKNYRSKIVDLLDKPIAVKILKPVDSV